MNEPSPRGTRKSAIISCSKTGEDTESADQMLQHLTHNPPQNLDPTALQEALEEAAQEEFRGVTP